MKYYLPSLYMAMNADERHLDRIQSEWDVNAGKFEEFLKTAPQVVKDFYEQVGSLHDSVFRFVPTYKSGYSIIDFDEVVFKPGFSVRLKIEYSKLVVDNALNEEFACDIQMFLYDEFQNDDEYGLSYHFFGTNGIEYGFKGITNLEWEIKRL